jgi:hypothetical protein
MPSPRTLLVGGASDALFEEKARAQRVPAIGKRRMRSMLK